MHKRKDVFGGIAASRTTVRSSELCFPEPVPIPDTVLPFSPESEVIEISHPERPNNAAELSRALALLRKQTSRYLENHAAEFVDTRSRRYLDSFDWRIEVEADRKGALSVFEGDGSWIEVAVPHYGEPIGKAATYYRTVFQAPDRTEGERIYLHFDGVDYKAHVFINGYYVGSHEGFFAPFEFDITNTLNPAENVLLVRVENDYICMGNDDPPAADGAPGADHQGDKLYAATGVGYDDPLHGWHHCPPGMGIYQTVYLETRSSLHIRDIFVRPKPEDESAQVWIEVQNDRGEEVSVRIEYSIYGRNFDETVLEHETYLPVVLERHGSGDIDRGEPKEIPLVMAPG